MIGKNWIKGLAGLTIAAGVAMPAISQAHTHYLGKTPASISMLPMFATSPAKSVKKVSTHKSSKHLAHHKKLTTAVHHKLTLKKHKVLSAKKRSV